MKHSCRGWCKTYAYIFILFSHDSPYLIIFPTISAINESITETTTQIPAMPPQNGKGYMEIISDFSLKNQLQPLKNSECSQLNIELKSTMAQMPRAKSPNIIILPVHTRLRPSALRPHKTKSNIQNTIAPKAHIPKAILILANSDLTSSRCEIQFASSE